MVKITTDTGNQLKVVRTVIERDQLLLDSLTIDVIKF